MAKYKTAQINNQMATLMIVFLGALLLGYLVGAGKNTRLRSYAQTSAQMMQREGRNMMEAGSMMGQAGQMMQQCDTEASSLGRTLEQKGTMMGTSGQGMMNQGSGLMDMMGGE